MKATRNRRPEYVFSYEFMLKGVTQTMLKYQERGKKRTFIPANSFVRAEVVTHRNRPRETGTVRREKGLTSYTWALFWQYRTVRLPFRPGGLAKLTKVLLPMGQCCLSWYFRISFASSTDQDTRCFGNISWIKSTLPRGTRQPPRVAREILLFLFHLLMNVRISLNCQEKLVLYRLCCEKTPFLHPTKWT